MTIPLRVDVPTRSLPFVVLGLAAANVACFLALVASGSESAALHLERFALVPRELLRALSRPEAVSPWVWSTPLTSMFLHGGLLHLAGNLLYLWVFGSHIEELLGRGRFLVFYLACGVVAALIHVASDPGGFLPTVGASGAVSGLLGAYAVSYPTARLRLLWPRVPVPALLFLAIWVALQLLSGLDPERGGVAWWAHVGGFAAGMALARSMWVRPPTRSRLRI